MIRLGLIGCGEHSEIGHAVPLARYKAEHPQDVDLAAVCDVKRDRAELFCRKYGFQNIYSDIDEMLAPRDLDVCIAVLPVEKISEIGIKLLGLGIPCALEKPLGASLSEVIKVRDAARTTGTSNMVSVNRRFMPLLNRGIEWCRESGNLRYVRATMTRHSRTEPEFLWTTAVHAVDVLRHIAGEIEKAEIRSLRTAPSSPQWFGIDVLFEKGVVGRVDILPSVGVLEETYELFGDDFRAAITAPFGRERGLRCYEGNRVVMQLVDEGIPEDVLHGFYDESSALIHALTHKTPLGPSVEDVFPSIELCFNLGKL
jgi:myo-inositol 2-dehydrogenase / D-chiro-inositol 1-dehydrogenase